MARKKKTLKRSMERISKLVRKPRKKLSRNRSRKKRKSDKMYSKRRPYKGFSLGRAGMRKGKRALPSENLCFGETKCAICMGGLWNVEEGDAGMSEEDAQVLKIPCGHCFHRKCLETLAQHSRGETNWGPYKCPLCKSMAGSGSDRPLNLTPTAPCRYEEYNDDAKAHYNSMKVGDRINVYTRGGRSSHRGQYHEARITANDPANEKLQVKGRSGQKWLSYSGGKIGNVVGESLVVEPEPEPEPEPAAWTVYPETNALVRPGGLFWTIDGWHQLPPTRTPANAGLDDDDALRAAVAASLAAPQEAQPEPEPEWMGPGLQDAESTVTATPLVAPERPPIGTPGHQLGTDPAMLDQLKSKIKEARKARDAAPGDRSMQDAYKSLERQYKSQKAMMSDRNSAMRRASMAEPLLPPPAVEAEAVEPPPPAEQEMMRANVESLRLAADHATQRGSQSQSPRQRQAAEAATARRVSEYREARDEYNQFYPSAEEASVPLPSWISFTET
jgi:hypothetical protein